MVPVVNASLSLILIALGILGVILSFLVPDRKKSLLSLVLAGIIVLTGAIQFGQNSMSQRRWKNRMKLTQQNRNVNLDELREKLKAKAAEAQQTVEKARKK